VSVRLLFSARLAARLGKAPLLALGAVRSDGLAGVAALSVLRTACALVAG
jgi:hypothetical protein